MIKTQSENIHYTQCLAKAAEGELLLIQGGFVLKRTETGTEPRFFLPPENRNRNRDEIFATAQL